MEVLICMFIMEYITVLVMYEMPDRYYKGCCVGFYWNSNNNICELCRPGYFGLNCTDKCPYPTYGDRCQGYCDCSNDTCDVSTGCITLTTDILKIKNPE
uniref:Uncharacterized protein n=1 Tax=Magallana gigas TaxID=29159 RepID=A0A8W8LNF1_MAGGI